MASLLRRLLGCGEGGEPKAEPLKCYICELDMGYRCSVCYSYICTCHTDSGTTKWLECAGEERQEGMH
jgi:hypothetical protein